MPLNTYSDVQNFITAILTKNISTQTNKPEINDIAGPNCPHGAFWTLPYDQFVNGNVPGLKNPVKILVKGNSAQSNLVHALAATPGSLFDPNTGQYDQMPANGPPMFTAAEIKEIADWIDAGCPQ
jgi:hypothetical protein